LADGVAGLFFIDGGIDAFKNRQTCLYGKRTSVKPKSGGGKMETETLELKEITGTATSVSEAMNTRHSIRRFETRPVEQAKLDALFSARAFAHPSWKNSQPWQVHVVTGEKRRPAGNACSPKPRLPATSNPTSPGLHGLPRRRQAPHV
jgi:hypothetical protein